MKKSIEVCTLNSEEAAALCRDYLTTQPAPPAGGSLYLRKDKPPSKLVKTDTRPYRRRMWSPKAVRDWCRQHHPPRIRNAFAVLKKAEEMEIAIRNAIDDALDGETRGAVIQLDTVEEILAAGDEP